MSLAIALPAAIALLASTPVQREDSPHVKRASSILEPSAAAGRSERTIAHELASMGQDGVPALIALLTGTVEPAEEAEAESPPPTLSRIAGWEEAILGALRLLPCAPIVADLETRCAPDSPIAIRMCALRVLGEVGDSSAVPLWARILAEMPEAELASSFVALAAQGSLEKILERDPRAVDRLAKLAGDLDRKILPLAGRAVAKCGHARAMETLGAILDAAGGPDPEGVAPAIVAAPAIVTAIGELGERIGSRPRQTTMERLRRALAGTDPRLASAAAIALGRLRDVASCPALIDHLQAEDPEVSRASAAALRMLACGDQGPDPERWRSWYATEIGWWERHGSDLLLRLEGRDRVQALEAARQLCSRPLFKDAAAAGVSELLTRGDPELAVAGCQVLAELGARTQIPKLVDALGHPSDSVRLAARAALLQLTGRDLPGETVVWKTALGL